MIWHTITAIVMKSHRAKLSLEIATIDFLVYTPNCLCIDVLINLSKLDSEKYNHL